MRVERYNPVDASYICIGHYESLKNPEDLKTRNRKLQEIDSVFESWCRDAERLTDPSTIKANWHHGKKVPREYQVSNSERAGVLVVNYGDEEIAHIYKTKENTGRWVSLL
jgi:hypothetical protein